MAINVTLKMYNNTITKQGENLMTKKEIISMIIDELTENALEEHRKKPVSYTHLDVYKRQVMYRRTTVTTHSVTYCPSQSPTHSAIAVSF